MQLQQPFLYAFAACASLVFLLWLVKSWIFGWPENQPVVGDFGYVLLLPCHCGAFGRPHTFCRRMKQVNLASVLQWVGKVGLLVFAV